MEPTVVNHENSAGREPGTPYGVDRDGTPLRVPAHGFGALRQGNSGQGGAPTKKEARERVLGLMDGPAFERDKAILTGWCLCPSCKEKWEVKELSESAYEGASNRSYRYGLGLKDEVALMDREKVLGGLAQVSAQEGWTPDQAARILGRLAEALGIE